ncbi:MAG: nucleotidyltransferase family protein [Candidatus Cryptobacteroides sp.]
MIDPTLTGAFLALVRTGLYGTPLPEEALRLSAAQWQDIHDESVRQTVTGIVHSALEMLPDEASLPDEELLMRWTVETDRIERQGKAMDRTLGGLIRFLHSQGLDPVLLKGQAAARLYPDPYRRECGDIDMYFHKAGEWDSARRILSERGISCTVKPDGSLSYILEGVEVEHHRNLTDICSPLKKRRLKSLEAQFGFRTAEIGETTVSVPSPELDFLLMSSHIMKHSFGKGVGLRQLCDIALLCSRGGTDERTMRCLSETAGILRWNRLLFSFLAGYLGVDPATLPYRTEGQADGRKLLEIVLEGGNFGKYSGQAPERYSGNSDDEVSSKYSCVLRRKLRTLIEFIGRLRFSFRLAPGETVWTMASLAAGQFRKSRP